MGGLQYTNAAPLEGIFKNTAREETWSHSIRYYRWCFFLWITDKEK